MRLFFFPLLPLLLVPLLVMAVMIFAIGAFMLRVLFFVAIAVVAGAVLFGSGLLRRVFRALGRGRRRAFNWCPNRRPDNSGNPPMPSDLGNSAFDDYRRATMAKLEDEAREFRTFLAKLRQAADAADFQAFLKSRRAGGS